MTHSAQVQYGAVEGGSDAPSDPLLAADYQPERGELKIKERRTWKSWQLLVAVVIAAVLGMWFNGNSGSASGIPGGSGSGGTSGGAYKLPPAAGSASTTTAASGGAATSTTAAGGATTTTAAGSATSTTAAGTGSTTTAPVVLAPPSVLVPETQQAGNWTSPAFTIAGGTWNIGWAFQCVPVPTATPTFQIFVVSNGAAPGASPAVTSSAASGNAVTPLTSSGSQQVIVQTAASCRWAVKVTGSGS